MLTYISGHVEQHVGVSHIPVVFEVTHCLHVIISIMNFYHLYCIESCEEITCK